MRVKTFNGKTEYEAMENAKLELGQNLTVLNIRKISKSGILPFLNKSRFEVTAAIDSNNSINGKATDNSAISDQGNNQIRQELIEKDKVIQKQIETIKELNDRITASNELIGTLSRDIMEASLNNKKPSDKRYDSEVLQMIFNTLINNDVLEPLADMLLQDLVSDHNNNDIDYCVKIVYSKILDIIGVPIAIDTNNSKNYLTPVLFMGPTGVGKTTTIAKLASKFILENKQVVGLITADTFRIAAIEQLRTYAEILNIEVDVVYNRQDMEKAYNNMRNRKNLILIDTAGRSHKSEEAIDDIKDFVETIPELKKYLVLSLSTKVEDLIEIVNTYSKDVDFNLIFTKLDETSSYASLLNVCFMTKKKVSYISFGQTVPNDIKVVDPKEIAKSILGFGGN